MIGYAKYFGINKKMSFKIIDKKLLKKYKNQHFNDIEFDSKPVYGDSDNT